jgi:hypothetical protein
VCKREVNPKSSSRDDLLWMTLAVPATGRHLASMPLSISLALTAALLGLALFAAWRGAQPPDLIKGVRMVPWRGVMLFSSAGVVFMLVHVVNLLGFTTGR